MEKTVRNQTIALAGTLQAVTMVKQLAHGEQYDQDDLQTMVGTVFETEPASIEAVYGGLAGVANGLRLLIRQLGDDTSQRDIETTKYLITLLHLEKQLMKRSDLLETVTAGIERARQQLNHFEPTHSNVIAGLADTYFTTISTLQPRIMVQGDPATLNSPENANRIRALLLSGVRSAILWKQAGGGKLRLIFGRKKILAQAHALCAELEEGYQ
ncbi:lysogenization regulator HflD [Solemya pervernicosa gill symbiont]|uniref:High frequency lysogenization protein HflD homolog n=2 Tax=Gammaproteobacteria incertae sedis TaxID=118884 RepID=A0A1T2LA67_9GAMM|nr:high frequency lysogenization protein HflD [Candidatus Reidiella endopervernicosa]OOZ41999.1 lysogenization regulator HflD [Solemya pervernicosa gill symbiont]QKQ27058.1 high frequency lysogenization protein HflD [Candidatus Reidiella endopervernicosa]